MKWITRARPKTDRIACPWLIRRFVDPDAEIIFVRADQVLAVAEAEGGYSFDAKDATYTHRGNQCTFEVLIDEYHLDRDPALRPPRQDCACRRHRRRLAHRPARPRPARYRRRWPCRRTRRPDPARPRQLCLRRPLRLVPTAHHRPGLVHPSWTVRRSDGLTDLPAALRARYLSVTADAKSCAGASTTATPYRVSAARTRRSSARPRSAAAAVWIAAALSRPAASASRAGSWTAATTTVCRATRLGRTGSSPSPSAPGSSVVNSTTSARLRSRSSTSATTRPKSVSTSAGCSGASAPISLRQAALGRGGHVGVGVGVDGEQVHPVTGVRGDAREQQRRVDRQVQARLAAGLGTTGPESAGEPGVAVQAGAPAQAGEVAIRPALVRPVSSTHSTRRSRSGRHCFTTTARAGRCPASRSRGDRRRSRTRAASRTRCPGPGRG